MDLSVSLTETGLVSATDIPLNQSYKSQTNTPGNVVWSQIVSASMHRNLTQTGLGTRTKIHSNLIFDFYSEIKQDKLDNRRRRK